MTFNSALQPYSFAHIVYLQARPAYTHTPDPEDYKSCIKIGHVNVIMANIARDCYATIMQKAYTSSMSCIGLLGWFFLQIEPFLFLYMARKAAINYQKQKQLQDTRNSYWLGRTFLLLYSYMPLIQKICLITSITLCTYYGNLSYLIGITAFVILKFAIRPGFLFSKEISGQLDSYLELLSHVIDVMFNPYLLFKLHGLLRINTLFNQVKSSVIK